MTGSRHFTFWVFTISILLVLILPTLFQEGMFMDGMLYATVSKNLSHGIGSFWFPQYSPTLYPFFDQQPPLGFGIQSVLFTLLGDSIYVERLYSFLCSLFTAYFITLLWRVIFHNESEVKKTSWLPVLLWITIPVCFWSYANNVLENTMAIFDLCAIVLITKYFLQKQKLIYILLAGLFVFLASFTKGIQGTFPLAAVFFGWLVYRNISLQRMVVISLLLLAVPVVIYFLILLNPQAHLALYTYLNHRVLNSIQNVSEVQSRFYLVGRLVQELIPAMVLTLVFILIGRQKTKRTNYFLVYKKHLLFLLLVGVSASFPLMVTLEQRGFYLTTSLPYFASAIALVSAKGLTQSIQQINVDQPVVKILRLFSLVVLAGVLVFSVLQTGKASRDADMIHDTKLIGKVVPRGTVMGSTRELWEQYALQEYLVRYFQIYQDDEILPAHQYMLVNGPGDLPASVNALKVDLPTVKYHLYKRVK